MKSGQRLTFELVLSLHVHVDIVIYVDKYTNYCSFEYIVKLLLYIFQKYIIK